MRCRVLLLALWLQAVPLGAQTLPAAWQRHVADIASYGTVLTAVAADLKASYDAPDRSRALLLNGARLGATWAATAAIKHYFPHARPCAPSDCDIDTPFSDWPSAHEAFATQAIGGARLAVAVPLALGTGVLRRLPNKHDWIGIAFGAAVGVPISRIR